MAVEGWVRFAKNIVQLGLCIVPFLERYLLWLLQFCLGKSRFVTVSGKRMLPDRSSAGCGRVSTRGCSRMPTASQVWGEDRPPLEGVSGSGWCSLCYRVWHRARAQQMTGAAILFFKVARKKIFKCECNCFDITSVFSVVPSNSRYLRNSIPIIF